MEVEGYIIPEDLLYTSSHEWIARQPDGNLKVGVTDYAQKMLHDVVYVDLPKAGARIEKGSVMGTIESVKAAEDLYAPVTGVVTAVNEKLQSAPELVNKDPYGEGWMLIVTPASPSELEGLLNPQGYAEVLRKLAKKES